MKKYKLPYHRVTSTAARRACSYTAATSPSSTTAAVLAPPIVALDFSRLEGVGQAPPPPSWCPSDLIPIHEPLTAVSHVVQLPVLTSKLGEALFRQLLQQLHPDQVREALACAEYELTSPNGQKFARAGGFAVFASPVPTTPTAAPSPRTTPTPPSNPPPSCVVSSHEFDAGVGFEAPAQRTKTRQSRSRSREVVLTTRTTSSRAQRLSPSPLRTVRYARSPTPTRSQWSRRSSPSPSSRPSSPYRRVYYPHHERVELDRRARYHDDELNHHDPRGFSRGLPPLQLGRPRSRSPAPRSPSRSRSRSPSRRRMVWRDGGHATTRFVVMRTRPSY